jgi:ATP-dependent helicase/nuclease subunit B
MGVIDKVQYKEEDGVTYLAVIDYKTGSTNIRLDNKEYGIGLQLPIYLYLSSKMKIKNVKIVGFYLQKLLSNNISQKNKDYQTERENALKLEGYSINNESILSKFDTTYNDSKLIKSMKTTNSGFYSYSKVLTEEEIDSLIEETEHLINKRIENILESDFTIDPKIIDGKNVSCEFCEYKDICYRREKDLIYINKEVNDSE